MKRLLLRLALATLSLLVIGAGCAKKTQTTLSSPAADTPPPLPTDAFTLTGVVSAVAPDRTPEIPAPTPTTPPSGSPEVSETPSPTPPGLPPKPGSMTLRVTRFDSSAANCSAATGGRVVVFWTWNTQFEPAGLV